jgi:hypothetical protein
VSPPFEVAEFDIMFGEGINSVGCVFDVAKETGVIETRVSSRWGNTAGSVLVLDKIAGSVLVLVGWWRGVRRAAMGGTWQQAAGGTSACEHERID